MADAEALKICRDLAAQIREAGLPVNGLVLYGSMARDEAHEWSDIDVLLLVRDDVPRDEMREVRKKAYRIAAAIDRRIELLTVYEGRLERDERTPIMEIARTQGIRIAA